MNEEFDLEQDGGRRDRNTRKDGERKKFDSAVLREKFDRITQNPIFIFVLLALLGLALITLFSLNTALYLQKQKNNQLVEENSRLLRENDKLVGKNLGLSNKVARKNSKIKSLSDSLAQKDQELSSTRSQVTSAEKKDPVSSPQVSSGSPQIAQPQTPQAGSAPPADLQSPQQPVSPEPEYMGTIE